MKSVHWYRWSAIGLAALVAAACGRDSDVAAPTPSLNTVPGGGMYVQLCKVGPVGTWADFTVAADGGQLPLGAGPFRVNALATVDLRSCPMIWFADTPGQVVTLTVTEVAGSPGTVLDRIRVWGGLDGDQLIEDPTGSVTIRVDFVTFGLIAFKNTAVPFEEECTGLTPGYWKNWRNHYTASQFASLLPGTIAGSIAQADAIFAAKPQSSPVAKLKWFVLANQLTLNLTGTTLPNPDDAGLGPLCDALGGGATLGGTLATALDMIAHPADYTAEQIDEVKDILDAIANME